MADTLVTASSKITLGVQGASAEAALLSNPTTGVITSNTRGSFIPAASSTSVIPFPSGITNIQALYIKSTDSVTGEEKEGTVEINDSATTFKVTELTLFCKTNPNIIKVEVTTMSGNTTKIEWLLAG